MKVGPGLCAFAMLCFFLTGPVGPCGPSSPFGLPLLFGGFLSAIVGWLVCVAALIGAAWSGTRSELGVPVLVAGALTGAIAAVAAFTTAQGPESWTAAGTAATVSWPPFSAISVVVYRSLRQKAKAGAATFKKASVVSRPR
jgi:hypothetical protein